MSAIDDARRSRQVLLQASLTLILAERTVAEAKGTVRLLKAETEFDAAADSLAAANARVRDSRASVGGDAW